MAEGVISSITFSLGCLWFACRRAELQAIVSEYVARYLLDAIVAISSHPASSVPAPIIPDGEPHNDLRLASIVQRSPESTEVSSRKWTQCIAWGIDILSCEYIALLPFDTSIVHELREPMTIDNARVSIVLGDFFPVACQVYRVRDQSANYQNATESALRPQVASRFKCCTISKSIGPGPSVRRSVHF